MNVASAVTLASPSTVAASDGEASRAPGRIASIDVFRGFVMFLMLFQMVGLDKVAGQLMDGEWGSFWSVVHFHTSHVEWVGGSLHDMIQPGFSFLVGAALAFSIVHRRQQGQGWWRMFLHAAVRALILIVLGVLLRNLRTERVNFQFTDTLCQIGLGYLFLFMIASLPRVWHAIAFVIILVGSWVAFVSYPLPPKDFDYPAVGVPADWPHHREGLAAHWNKNSNLAAAFDQWWLNQFPHEKPFRFHSGGYATLNFIPTLATMILGLMAGNWLRDRVSLSIQTRRFLIAIVACLAIGWILDATDLCPIVKRLWSPSWVLWSGGICLTFLYVFHLICDVKGWKNWAFPLTVIGANSIAAYVMSFATVPFLKSRIESWLSFVWQPMGDWAIPLIGLLAFAIVWYVLYSLHRHRWYIRI